MKTVLVSPRTKVMQGMMLDAIPEDEEMVKEQMNMCNGLVRQRKLQIEVVLGKTANFDQLMASAQEAIENGNSED
ncbi:hypothetical protein CASFOL_032579 [Castilleja foliolosa]|uniref:Uncharacterized protein n=1 Tax=Castilleja foliolosa TaxID=1961234 RepID=A0ABD3C2R2_9LAMI